MTAPKPSAHTAAQLRVLFGANPCQNPGHADPPCTWNQRAAQLDDLLAAARAEAVAEYLRKQDEAAQAESDEDERVWAEIKATPLDVIEAELLEAGCDTDNLTKQTRTVVRLSLERNKAVREKDAALEVLRELVAACRKCANCESPAMRKAASEALYCDAHGYYLSGTQMDDHRIAAPLRLALALLAADQAGEKAGKP